MVPQPTSGSPQPTPGASSAQPAYPDPARPDPARPDPARPGPARPGPVLPDAAHPDARTRSREALLTAARQLFAEHGFDRTTMRAVAGRANVDPALIYHYFPGGKRALLAETLTLPGELVALMAGVGADPQHAGTELVERALLTWDEHPQVREQGVALIRIAVSSQTAGDLVRPTIQAFVLGLIGGALREDHRDLRAGLVLAAMQGVLLHRYVLRLPPLATAPHQVIVGTLGPVIQHYLTGDLTELDPSG